MKISICIPTYNRLAFLKEAIQSCLLQTYQPSEILIGDDSSNDHTGKWITTLPESIPVEMRYYHNSPPLRQAANVNNLFWKAKGELIVLLHDDDILLPNAIEDLHACFINYPSIDAAFGKQYLISNEGMVDEKNSEVFNRSFYRSTEYEGIKLTALECGFLQQFPNDCYMIKKDIIMRTYYNDRYGDACDFAFGLKLGMGNFQMYFKDKYTAKYRVSKEAITTKPTNNAGIISFELVKKLHVPKESLNYKFQWLIQKAPIALVEAANLKNPKVAFQIYFSRWHRRKVFTIGGIWRFFLIFYSFLRRRNKPGRLYSR